MAGMLEVLMVVVMCEALAASVLEHFPVLLAYHKIVGYM